VYNGALIETCIIFALSNLLRLQNQNRKTQ